MFEIIFILSYIFAASLMATLLYYAIRKFEDWIDEE